MFGNYYKGKVMKIMRLYQKYIYHREPGGCTEETELYIIGYQASVISDHSQIPLWLIKLLTFKTASIYIYLSYI